MEHVLPEFMGVHFIYTIQMDGEVEEGALIEQCSTGKRHFPGISVGEVQNKSGWLEFLQIVQGAEHLTARTEAARLTRFPERSDSGAFRLEPRTKGNRADFALVRVLLPYHEKQSRALVERRPYQLARGRFADPRLEPFKQGIFRLSVGETLLLVDMTTGRPKRLRYTFDGTQLLRK